MTEIRQDAALRALIVATILAPLVLIGGCAEGNSLGTSKQAEGIVYDGYLSGAKVCVDQVVNRQCDDPPEPATFTDLQGNFSLLDLTPEQARFPIVAEVVAGTIDLDTGLPAPAGLKYLAPAGSTAISAFSTIIQIRIEQQIAAGLDAVPIAVPSLATLKATVTAGLATELGLPAGMDLTRYDPIAAANNTSLNAADRLLAVKLHIVSRILSAQIAQFLPLAEANADPGKESAAYAALLANLDVAQALVDLETYITANSLTLNDLLDPGFDPSLVPVADPAVPTNADINLQFATDANVLQAITDMVNSEPPVSGGGGGTPP